MPQSLGRLVGIVSSSAVAVEYRHDLGEANDAGVEKASTAPNNAANWQEINTSVEVLILILLLGRNNCISVCNFSVCRIGIFVASVTYCVFAV